jgi:Mrp family chromosome partitioning ATPase
VPLLDKSTSASPSKRQKTSTDLLDGERRVRALLAGVIQSTTMLKLFRAATYVDRTQFRHGAKGGVPLLSIWRKQERFLRTLSKRQFARLEDHLYSAVASAVKDPLLDKSLQSLDWLHRRVALSDDGTLQLLLRLPTLLHPELRVLKDRVKDQARGTVVEWSRSEGLQIDSPKVNVEAVATTPLSMMARLVDDTDELFQSLGRGLATVSHFVAVYSCKGGVGKSTVAVNLAYELARRGGRVGLLDLDIYGPSLPLLVKPSDITIRPSPIGEGMIYPIRHENVKLLSLGYVNTSSGVPGSGQGNGASVMRGPMAGKVCSQLLKGTDWGELDVLILDLPPGTGDVQLQVLQDIQISCSIAVSTPSKLAVLDTRKGIEMFSSLGVPTVAVVENMAYFECQGGTKHFPFGRGLAHQEGSDRPSFMDGLEVIQLPISEYTNAANDSGEPLCLTSDPETAKELAAFDKLADVLSGELLKLQFGITKSELTASFPEVEDTFDVATVHVALDKPNETFVVRFFGDSGAVQRKVPAASLRARDPKTGSILKDSPFQHLAKGSSDEAPSMIHQHRAKKAPSIQPTSIQKRGRYGYGVQWADGATIIYAMRSLAKAAGATIHENDQ